MTPKVGLIRLISVDEAYKYITARDFPAEAILGTTLDIRSLGRSGFAIKTQVGTVLIDPSDEYLSTPQEDPNTIVAYSRTNHKPRVSPPGIRKLIEGPGEYEIGGVSIRGIATVADDTSNSKGINTCYSIDADGVVLCSTGAIAQQPDALAGQAIGKPHILLIDPDASPMSADELSSLVRSVEANVIIPSGYDEGSSSPGSAMAELFTELGTKNPSATTRASYSKANMPENRTVVLLTR